MQFLLAVTKRCGFLWGGGRAACQSGKQAEEQTVLYRFQDSTVNCLKRLVSFKKMGFSQPKRRCRSCLSE